MRGMDKAKRMTKDNGDNQQLSWNKMAQRMVNVIES